MQKFFDYCVRQIELSIREIGYGDATINKKMKDYVNLLFSIIDKIDSWDLLTQKYLNYFEEYCKFLRKNSFNNLTKDIINF